MSDDAFWAKVHAFVEALPNLSYYEVLRVDRAATPDQVREQYYRWAPTLHPDRFARERDKTRKWELSLLYSRMREACDVLSDPVKRKHYDEGLKAGSKRYKEPSKEAAAPALPTDERARRFYKLGMERLRAGAKSEAQFHFQMALQMEPRSALIRKALQELGVEIQPSRRPVPSTSRAAAPRPKPSTPKPAMPSAPTSMKRPGASPSSGRKGPSAAASRLLANSKRGGGARPAPRARTPLKRAAPPARGPSAARPKIPTVKPTGQVSSIVGIDFGTTRSSLSVAIGDKVFMVPDERNRTLHPSVVHFDDNGVSSCGWAAREMVYRKPRRTVASPKRLLGRNFSDPGVAGLLHNTAYETVAGPNDAIVIRMQGVVAAVTQVCAEIVGHVRDVSERRIKTAIKEAVFSVPVTFGDAERQAVQTMARIAGLGVAGFIEEPVAAAMAYGFGKDKNEIVAVYDFGGGTFDFTVIDISGYHFQVLARGGDAWLGGDDFDEVMAKTVANALWRATKIDIQNRQVEYQRLMFACEKAKRELSLRNETNIVCDQLIEQPKPINLKQRITRPQFEQMCRELFEQSLRICKRALDDAGLDPSDIHQVVASGGVSYMPFVREGLSTFFGKAIAPSVSPDEAICLGAGFRAAQLARQPVTGIARMG